jgi:hypothetical protein
MTLFVPKSARGLVAPETGQIALKRIVIPVDRHPSPQPALSLAGRLSLINADTPLDIVLLHVGSAGPQLTPPDLPNGTWHRLDREGEVVDEILQVADALKADLLMMTTQGHQGILDALRGSVTEQVVRHAPCPILAIPAG